MSYFREVQFGCIFLHPVPRTAPCHDTCLYRHNNSNGQQSISGQSRVNSLLQRLTRYQFQLI